MATATCYNGHEWSVPETTEARPNGWVHIEAGEIGTCPECGGDYRTFTMANGFIAVSRPTIVEEAAEIVREAERRSFFERT